MKRHLILLCPLALALCLPAGCTPAEEPGSGGNELLLAKPVIYLYPEAETEVTVTLDCDGGLSCAYPAYEDGWVDEHAKIVFMNGERDQVTLSCYYPGTVTGDQVCQVTVNGKRMPDLVFTDQNMTYEIPSAPYQMIELELSCNFYVANAKETRGEEKLAMIVTINAE